MSEKKIVDFALDYMEKTFFQTFHVYASYYNFLRIYSGMSGLAYSSQIKKMKEKKVTIK